MCTKLSFFPFQLIWNLKLFFLYYLFSSDRRVFTSFTGSARNQTDDDAWVYHPASETKNCTLSTLVVSAAAVQESREEVERAKSDFEEIFSFFRLLAGTRRSFLSFHGNSLFHSFFLLLFQATCRWLETRERVLCTGCEMPSIIIRIAEKITQKKEEMNEDQR